MKIFLISVIMLTGCGYRSVEKTSFSLGNEEECVWIKREVSIDSRKLSSKLFYCCPNRKKDKFYPVCVENFFVFSGKEKDWDR